MDTLISLRILTEGKCLPSDQLFREKEFERLFVQHTREMFHAFFAKNAEIRNDYQHLFEGEGKFEIQRRELYLRRVQDYVATMAGLIWLTGNGNTFSLIDDRICQAYIGAAFGFEHAPIPSEDVFEARQIMEEDIGSREALCEQIRHGRYQRGKAKIEEGRRTANR